jgi:hypothetical protein
MRIGIIILCMAACFSSSWGQSRHHVGAWGGIQYGGPIPSKVDPDSSGGKAALGPSLGVFWSMDLGEKWRLNAGLGYAFKGAEYWQTVRQDTMMPMEILPGMHDTVPTYYVADVKGKISLHYLEVPLTLQYKLGKSMWLEGGLYGAFLLAGKDPGTSDIQIGDGTLFPDTVLVFDNFREMNRVDVGFSLGGMYCFKQGLFIELKAQRSIRGLYRKGFLSEQGLEEIPLYHTQMCLSLGWRF